MEFVYGCSGGILGTILSHPFDTMRICLQTGGSVKSLCIKQLYNGIMPPLFGIALEKTIIFGIYSEMIKKTNNDLLSGYIAGVASVFFVTPIEKFKIQLQSNQKIQFKNFYSGFVATMFREPIGYMLYFWSYKKMMDLEKLSNSSNSSNSSVNLLKVPIYGGLSGCFSWLFIYPADRLKTLKQLYPEKTYFKLYTIITKEGIYKGFSQAIFRAFPLHGGVFLGYEVSKRLLRG